MMTMTIREAIRIFSERKANVLNRKYLDIIFDTSLCIIIPMKNGVRIFIDTHPEAEYLGRDYPLQMPNKYGIFKRISFEICDDTEPIISESMIKYISKSSCTGTLFYADTVPEKVINEFINDNGGIDIDEFIDNINSLYPAK